MSDTEDSEDDQYLIENNSPIYETDIDDDEEGDWITLNGCDKITRWQFPQNVTRCAEPSCCLDFEVRSAAITHYKDQHAAHAILCYICDKPIRAESPNEYETHFDTIHPGVNVPFVFGPTKECPEKPEEIADEIEEADDSIQLSGCGKITCWKFPLKSTRCPIGSCNLECGYRSAAIQHYKKQHAQNSIFCYWCELPILAYHPNDFKRHYKEEHKDMEMPFNFDTKIKYSTNREAPIDEEVEENGVDDLITLTYSDVTTHWRFPKFVTKCPILSCSMQFHNRSNVIAHYKEYHAKGSILCPICDKPIRVGKCRFNFKKHYRRMHPFQQIPHNTSNGSDEAEGSEPEATEVNDSDDGHQNDQDDLITLTGCGKITQWKFPPNLTKCPVKRCSKQYRTRVDAIAHYKKKHAKKSILCFVCARPLIMQSRHHFIQHFNSAHPSIALPFNFDNNMIRSRNVNTVSQDDKDEERIQEDDLITLRGCGQITQWRFPEHMTRCPFVRCHQHFESRPDAIDHFKMNHTVNMILCFTCNKPIRSAYPIQFIDHHRNRHQHIPMPFDFSERKTCWKKHAPLATKVGEASINISEIDQNEDESEEGDPIMPNNGDDEKQDANDDLITLSSIGITTQWRYPKEFRRCPVGNCNMKFKDRSAAINHYKIQHAEGSILCLICDKPIRSSKSSQDYREHYRVKHPNNQVPFGFQTKRFFKSVEHELQTEKPKDDDLITLNGCGIVTQWRFPKGSKKCPVGNCRKIFKVRSDAIAHYKKRHAMDAILCEICDKPISTKTYRYFIKHNRLKHPKVWKRLLKEHENEESDLITLIGLGRITYWRFPNNLKKCPLHTCPMAFKDRSGAIAHYKEQHAKGSILCPLCNWPVCANCNPKEFISHYNEKHSNIPLPYEFGNNATQPMEEEFPIKDAEDSDVITLSGLDVITKWRFPENLSKCPVSNCSLPFDARSDAIAHYRVSHAENNILCSICDEPIPVPVSKKQLVAHYEKVHSTGTKNVGVVERWKTSRRMPCPLKDCTFRTKRKHKLRKHWTEVHGDLRFPEVRLGSGFGYSINDRDRTEQTDPAEQMDLDSDESLLQPVSTPSNSSDKSGSEFNARYQDQMPELERSHSKRPKIVSYDSSPTGDETSEGETDDFGDIRKRKMMNERADDSDEDSVLFEFEGSIKAEPVSSESDPLETSTILNESTSNFIEIYPSSVVKQEDTDQESQDISTLDEIPPSFIGEETAMNTIDSNHVPELISNIPKEHDNTSSTQKRRSSI